ncbi:exo-beta-N-acetylmuramidase NamZ domain-containing protein [Pseudoalteromonas xiamenensis]|uniref:exo-beta-N-acetylmuramidase NamZ family protein n=1 Tax=Pseudoalteromonas xiamenensis TaxID=882626 RepID=UPI0035E94750
MFMRVLFLYLCLAVSFQTVSLTLGIQKLDSIVPDLKDKRVGVVVNHTSQYQGVHLVDSLLAKNIKVVRIFSPEHGFRGDQDAGASIANGQDTQTGVAIFSLYGKTKKPTPESLANIDMLIFDIQDVGVRFYTYISTMHYVMEAAAEHGIPLIVLDRPNPNLAFVDGPVLEPEFRSFVGMHPIPVLHGMTVGELAKMIKGEGWIALAEKLQLTVVPMSDYNESVRVSLPIPPSPNLPNDQAVQLYPSLCFFEGTAVSVGRGTSWPFQLYGHNKVALGKFNITPHPNNGASNPKLNGQLLYASDLRQSNVHGLSLEWLVSSYSKFAAANEPFFTAASFFDKLAGTDKLRLGILAGKSSEQIKKDWQDDLLAFRTRRAPYLIYERILDPK